MFWAFALVAILGIVGVIFEIGRQGATQSELQSFADSVSIAAAAELDGRPDALTRATSAAQTLIADSQTFGDGGAALNADDIAALTFYAPAADGGFRRDPALVTTVPSRARYVAVDIAPRRVASGLGAAFAALSGIAPPDATVAARAAAGFSLEACNVAPVAVCLPSVEFDAAASIGQTLELRAAVNLSRLLPGQIAAVDTLTGALDGLEICAGLLGGDLNACLLAAREPETACTGQGGLVISADVNGTGLMDALNTRFDRFRGVASGLAGNPDFSGAPNVLTGLTNALGICVPLSLPVLSNRNIGLPADDCIRQGTCSVQGNGGWTQGRQAYVNANYNGTDPFPTATTRFEFYRREIAAAASAGPLPIVGGGGLGGLLGGGGLPSFTPRLCAPQTNPDPTRRLMVVAGIDCLSASVDATVSAPPVQQFFEVFALGPVTDGTLSVEITACLGGPCGGGNTGAEVRDIVRLVE